MKKTTFLTIENLKANLELDYINSIWYAIMNMNTNLLKILLDDNKTYEDVNKKEFIELLNDRFNDFKTKGDSKFLMDISYCYHCNNNLPVCKFIGNNSGKHFALYFDISKGEIKDIYTCNMYSCD